MVTQVPGTPGRQRQRDADADDDTQPERIVFVGGAPRSGTTITHALLCTSLSVSDYQPEISFFRGFTEAYRNGRGAWQQHTSHFFDNPEEFRAHMRRTSDLSLRHIWRRLGAPRILAVKDPLLTPYFPELHSLYPDVGYFVTVVRHPFDVVRSRQEVQGKSAPERPFSLQDAAAVSREYVTLYRTVLGTNYGGRHFAFRYEDLASESIQQGLAKFIGVDDFYARPMWGKPPDIGDDPWGSPKYHKPINLEPRLSPLAPELKEVVRSICHPLMERFGYS